MTDMQQWDYPEPIRRVWLVSKEEKDVSNLRILLRFPEGVVSTCCNRVLSFEEEDRLMESLKGTHELLGDVFFDGMPLKQFQRILDKIGELQRTDARRLRASGAQLQDELYAKCDTLWAEVLSEVAEAVKISLQNEERSISLL